MSFFPYLSSRNIVSCLYGNTGTFRTLRNDLKDHFPTNHVSVFLMKIEDENFCHQVFLWLKILRFGFFWNKKLDRTQVCSVDGFTTTLHVFRPCITYPRPWPNLIVFFLLNPICFHVHKHYVIGFLLSYGFLICGELLSVHSFYVWDEPPPKKRLWMAFTLESILFSQTDSHSLCRSLWHSDSLPLKLVIIHS